MTLDNCESEATADEANGEADAILAFASTPPLLRKAEIIDVKMITQGGHAEVRQKVIYNVTKIIY